MGTPIEDAIQTMATKRGITADDMRAVLMDAVKARGSDFAARETMAYNFANAITHLDDGYDGFKSPEILEGIVDYLKTGTEVNNAA